MVTNCTYRNDNWLTQAVTGHRYTWDFENQLQGVYRYTPYGELTILAADGTTVRSASNYANPYTFTGRRWDSETGLNFYRARYLHPALGRFIGRDPMSIVAGANTYGYAEACPIRLLDAFGLWGDDVHNYKTWGWALDLGYPEPAAQAIGSWDAAVDNYAVSTAPGWAPNIVGGEQSYHFDQPWGDGIDSRLEHMEGHFFEACKAGNWTKMRNDDPDEAVKQLGISLHPLQDWVAHGDYGRYDNNWNGGNWTVHNSPSPQKPLLGKPSVSHYPDDVELDAGGPYGRPAGGAIHLTWNGGNMRSITWEPNGLSLQNRRPWASFRLFGGSSGYLEGPTADVGNISASPEILPDQIDTGVLFHCHLCRMGHHLGSGKCDVHSRPTSWQLGLEQACVLPERY